MPAEPNPEPAEVLQRAFRAHQDGRLDEAEGLYASVLASSPDNFDALHLLGLINHQQGRQAQALSLIGAALRSNARSAEALSNCGLVLHALERAEEALAKYEEALAVAPGHAEVLNNRGNTLRQLRRYSDALASFDQALALKPDYVTALYNRGTTLSDLGRPEEALATFDRLLTLHPNHPQTLCNRANALVRLDRLDEAIASYDAALGMAPDHPDILVNKAHALRHLGRLSAALAVAKKAVRHGPDSPAANWELGQAQLGLGKFRAGWKSYERRWATEEFAPQRRDFSVPLWLGEKPLAGKTILLHAEQGFGDTIQFARYVPLVARQGAKVILEVQPDLETLLSGIEGADQVIGRGQTLPAFDLHCPLLSLPLAFKTELSTIPATVPYLTAPPSRVAEWAERLRPGRPRVGLVWSGRATHKSYYDRSIALARLKPLLADTNARFVSLQHDMTGADAECLRELPNVARIGHDFRDFADTAAVVSQLDLVISIDTAMAHLCGAMGKPVWVLLPFAADFRWLTDRTDTPWYPTMRLFRQRVRGDWDDVIARVARELAKLTRS